MYKLLAAVSEKCEANSFVNIVVDPPTLNPHYQMGWGPCPKSGCAGFVKQYGNDICERCGYHYDEHD